MKNAILIGALLGAIVSTQVLAGEENACLQRNRLQSWRVIDKDTLEMTDKLMKVYRVTFRDACPNATETNATLVFGRAWTNLGCLSRGMPINVAVPGRGVRTCRVAGVQAPAPDQPAG